jgi:hypothetical protein
MIQDAPLRVCEKKSRSAGGTARATPDKPAVFNGGVGGARLPARLRGRFFPDPYSCGSRVAGLTADPTAKTNIIRIVFSL